MAEGGYDKLLQVTVNFEGSRTVLHLPKDMKVGRAIQKAAENFKVDPKGLTFLYHGNEITDDMTVKDALGQASNVTVIHLIKVSNKKTTTARLAVADRPREIVYGYCKECGCLVPAREVFLCKWCKDSSLFQRKSAVPLNHFAREIDPELLKGSCSGCNKDDLEAVVEFECTACDKAGVRVGPLRQIRANTYNVNCMKCGGKEDLVFRFACSSKHCMCLGCFSFMCQQLLNAKKFRNFEGMGYSIGCPAAGNDCLATPVPDPHHFKVVDDLTPNFYEKFHKMSIEQFQPSGDGILCSCKTIIDFTNSKPVDVTEPEGAASSVSGLKWYQRILGIRPAPPPPRTRRRTSCAKCQLTYCVACKQVWHEGDCQMINDDLVEAEQAYPIDPKRAQESRWPGQD